VLSIDTVLAVHHQGALLRAMHPGSPTTSRPGVFIRSMANRVALGGLLSGRIQARC